MSDKCLINILNCTTWRDVQAGERDRTAGEWGCGAGELGRGAGGRVGIQVDEAEEVF